MRSTVWENSPAGCLLVPLNIRCSRKCASPDLPGVSSAEPTLYQTICVTTGVRWSWITRTCRPFGRVKLAGGSEVTVVWANAPDADSTSVAQTEATRPKAPRRYTARRYGNIITCVKSPNGSVRDSTAPYIAYRIRVLSRNREIRRLIAVLTGGRIIFFI